MKRTLFFLFAFIFLRSIQAQNWCAPGAEWHYRVEVPGYLFHQDGYLKVAVVGSNTLGGIVYHSLKGTYYGRMAPPYSPTLTTSNYYSAVTYENNKVVYVSRRDTLIFDTIANFNASIGDQWRIADFYNECSSPWWDPIPIVTVIDTGHVTINGQSLKKLTLTWNPSVISQTISMIEKIGGTVGFMYPYEACRIDDRSYGSFVCYSDNNFPLYQNPGYNLPCDFTTVGKDEFTLEGLELNVFPNPATEKVKIEFRGENSPQQVQLIVHDLLGKEVLSQDCFSGLEVNLRNLKEGLYTLSFVSESKVLAIRKLLISE